MKNATIIEGVAAEYNGKYWGTEYADGHCTVKSFGPLSDAEISDPRYCKKPTDNTWTPGDGRYNPDYDQLLKARLVPVRKTITVETI